MAGLILPLIQRYSCSSIHLGLGGVSWRPAGDRVPRVVEAFDFEAARQPAHQPEPPKSGGFDFEAARAKVQAAAATRAVRGIRTLSVVGGGG